MPGSLSRRHLFAPVRSRPMPLAAAAASPAVLPEALAVPLPLPVPSAELHTLSRATFGPTPSEQAAIAALGGDAWLELQLQPDAIDDSAFEAVLAGIVAPFSGSGADIRLLARAIGSPRQLAWRMVHFLNNHFSTYRGATQGISETTEDDEFHKQCFGSFASVLSLSARSPAMIDTLDSNSNIAASPNENYARELLELHTLGVGGGYTEADVAAAARVFTGWSRSNVASVPGGPITASYFRFRANRHDAGPKTLSIGWSTPGIAGEGGVDEGLSLLAFLAAHPNTATRFCGKLCQYFVADQPPAGLLARVRQRFVATAGDLRETVRAVFQDPEFATTATARAKVHDGFELVANAVRRLRFPSVNFSNLNTRVAGLRSQPHQNPVPTGYPEVGPAWQGAGNVLSRWDFADDLVHDRIGGVVVPWPALFGAVPPTSGASWAQAMCELLVDGEVPATTLLVLTIFMDQRLLTLPGNPSWTQVRPHARALASLVLRLPEAQLH